MAELSSGHEHCTQPGAPPTRGNQDVTGEENEEGETEMTQNNSERPKSNRGFASMDAQKQREIASKGGRAAHAQGRAHEFTPDEARTAGRKGGEVVSRDRAHMAAIGRAGGQARGRNRALQAAREATTTRGENTNSTNLERQATVHPAE
jgi:general stress protein YciG